MGKINLFAIDSSFLLKNYQWNALIATRQWILFYFFRLRKQINRRAAASCMRCIAHPQRRRFHFSLFLFFIFAIRLICGASMLLNAAGDFIFCLFVIEFIARNSIVCGRSRCTQWHQTRLLQFHKCFSVHWVPLRMPRMCVFCDWSNAWSEI